MNFATLSTFFGKEVCLFVGGHWFVGKLKETQEADFVILEDVYHETNLIDIASISVIRKD